jgi:hypothetical protein
MYAKGHQVPGRVVFRAPPPVYPGYPPPGVPYPDASGYRPPAPPSGNPPPSTVAPPAGFPPPNTPPPPLG